MYRERGYTDVVARQVKTAHPTRSKFSEVKEERRELEKEKGKEQGKNRCLTFFDARLQQA